MSDALPVKSFEIEGFRGIRELRLPELSRVNLFVGKNNAGKTSLLQALELYLHRNSHELPAVLLGIIRDQADLRPLPVRLSGEQTDPEDLEAIVDAVEGLFYGAFDEKVLWPVRLIPEIMPSTGLTVSLPWTVEVVSGDEANSRRRPVLLDPDAAILTLSSEALEHQLPLEWLARRVPLARRGEKSIALAISSSGLSAAQTRSIWDNIAVAGDEALVEEALRVVVPDLDRILLVGEARARTVLCKLKGVTRPVPIKSMGDGVNRVFGLAVAMTDSRGGSVLIDEVENGLHHSIQDDVWASIFTLAEQFGVQVFATTHSWETVVAFQRAANRSDSEGLLYRLEREADGAIYTERYTEKEVAVAAEQQVEVR
jgi:energy-coupling factor transporter ATP-binding protein EcfA2